MVTLPTQSPTIEAIYQHYVDENEKEPRRKYLGGSIIGEECSRALWFNFRWADEPKFPGRILRLFSTGDREEERIIADLRAVGCQVWDRDDDGEQFRYSAFGGHLSTGADGVVLGLLESPKTPHLFEGKTKNKRLFAVLKKDGIEDKHVAQMQLLMGLAKLKRAVYICQCKDDDDLHLERIKFEPKRYKALKLKAERIIFADSPPMRIADDAASWSCKWCDYSDVCWGRKVAAHNCRTCAHSTPLREGGWDCAKDEPCDDHLFIPPLLDWAGPPIDGGSGFVEYEKFANVSAKGFPASEKPHYGSRELSCCRPASIGVPEIESALKVLGGEVVGQDKDASIPVDNFQYAITQINKRIESQFKNVPYFKEPHSSHGRFPYVTIEKGQHEFYGETRTWLVRWGNCRCTENNLHSAIDGMVNNIEEYAYNRGKGGETDQQCAANALIKELNKESWNWRR